MTQKVEGFVVGFTWQRERKTIIKKILLISRSVKGKISSSNCPIFPAKIADFGLNYCILNVKAKNNITRKYCAFQDIVPYPAKRAKLRYKKNI